MARYRVKAGAKRAGGFSADYLVGAEFEWDGVTLDWSGDITVDSGSHYGFVLPEYVEPVGLVEELVKPPKVAVEDTVREEVVKHVEKTVVLRLTEDEAQALADVLGLVGGGERNSRRRYISPVSGALASAGYLSTVWAPDKSGVITFLEV